MSLTLQFEGRRLALDMLDIVVWLDGENIEITGIIEREKAGTRCARSQNDMSNVNRRLFVGAI